MTGASSNSASPEWVAGLRRGEAAAFDAVYAAYRPRIFNFLLRLTGRRELAEDLFQETFLQLARHATRLLPDTDIAAWLYTVARNRYRNHRRWTFFDRQKREALMIDESVSPHGRIEARERQRRVERGLAQLSAADREVLILVAIEGLAQDQVAAILGVGHDAIRQRVTRARARLLALMDEKESTHG